MFNSKGLVVLCSFLLLLCGVVNSRRKKYNSKKRELSTLRRDLVKTRDARITSDAEIGQKRIRSKHDSKKDVSTQKKQNRKEIMQVPYIPRDIVNKLQEVDDVSDVIRVFNVKGIKERTIQMDGHEAKKIIDDLLVKVLESKRIVDDALCEGQCQKPKRKKLYSVAMMEDNMVVRRDFKFDDTGCKPRSHIYTIPLPKNAQFIYLPSCVETKKCQGCCQTVATQKCVGDKTSTEQRTVMLVHFNTSTSFTTVNIPKDETCKCACRIDQSQCQPTQTFDPKSCLCQCNDTPKDCGEGKQWSKRECDCICSTTPQCTVHQILDKDKCKCKCKIDQCPSGTFLDRNTCQCITSQTNTKRSLA